MTASTNRAANLAGGAANFDALEHWVAWTRQWSAEFPYCLANHLPMILVALHRMGADEQRLEAYCHTYKDMNGLVPVPEPIQPITAATWRDHLGEREREGDYRAFFVGEVARLGADAAARLYLPDLFPGFAASATHAFMRMAYATMTDSDAETAVALGYWAATYLPLGDATGAPPVTKDPAEVLAYMYGPPGFRQVEIEHDLLWHFIRAVARKPEFTGVVDRLAIGPETYDRVRRTSLALFAATGEFSALHALTGSHWLRLMAPRAPDPAVPLRYFWQVIASLVPKIGFPVLPTEAELEEWRHATTPDWPEIFKEAVRHDDEHDLSLTFSASEEFKRHGDPLYRYCAARRLGMI